MSKALKKWYIEIFIRRIDIALLTKTWKYHFEVWSITLNHLAYSNLCLYQTLCFGTGVQFQTSVDDFEIMYKTNMLTIGLGALLRVREEKQKKREGQWEETKSQSGGPTKRGKGGWDWILGGGGEGHSNISVVHMHDQRFPKHTLIKICPFQEKHHLNKNFWGTLENNLYTLLSRIHKGCFFLKIGTFWPLIGTPKNRI